MIIQGTTPEISIKVANTDLSTFDEVVMYLKQANNVIEKKKSAGDVSIGGEGNDTATIGLTQQETIALNPNYPLRIQMRVKSGDVVMASNVIKTDVAPILDKEILQ